MRVETDELEVVERVAALDVGTAEVVCCARVPGGPVVRAHTFTGPIATCTIWYMLTSNSVSISVPPEVVWSVFSDVERWPTWTRSVTSIQPLDGPAIAVGRRFRIKQPRLPALIWQVTDVEPGRSWTWMAGAVGARTYASHEIVRDGDAATVVTQRIDQRGPVGILFGAVTRTLTRRYLALEADGLKAASEDRGQRAAQR